MDKGAKGQGQASAAPSSGQNSGKQGNKGGPSDRQPLRGAQATPDRLQWSLERQDEDQGDAGHMVLAEGESLVGRKGAVSAAAAVQLDSPTVSANHAILTVGDDGRQCAVRDEGSLNGTWLNGSQLRPGMSVRVYPGDSLLFGDPYQDPPLVLGARAAPPAPRPRDDANGGNPLGRKALGRKAAEWVREGMAACAASFAADAAARGPAAAVDEGFSLITFAQASLDARPVPDGAEEACARARGHYPTLWDHFQREVRECAKAADGPGWKGGPAWMAVKRVPSTPAHAEFAAAAAEAAAAARGGGIGGAEPNGGARARGKGGRKERGGGEGTSGAIPRDPAKEALWKECAAAQARVDEYVAAALDMLELERAAAFEEPASEDALLLVPLPGLDAPAGGGDGGASLGDVCVLGSPCDSEGVAATSLRGLAVVSSQRAAGSGALVVRLMAFGGGGRPIRANTLGVGDAVCLAPDAAASDAGAAWEVVLGGGAPVFGTISAVDETSLLVEVTSRRANAAVEALVGLPLQLSRSADSVTHDRQVAALERLKSDAKRLYVSARQYRREGCPPPPDAAPLILRLFSEEGEGGGVADAEWARLQGRGPPASKGGLDKSQVAAVDAAVDASAPVTLIQGPPGTGKTGVLVAAIAGAVAQGERVLASAASNMAVDNLLERLAAEGVRVVRVGSPQKASEVARRFALGSQVDETLQGIRAEYLLQRSVLAEQIRIAEAKVARSGRGGGGLEELRALQKAARKMQRQHAQREKGAARFVLENAEVVLATNTAAGGPELAGLPAFDLVVLDEASQATEPSAWVPLLLGRRAVVAGDPCQLAPTVRSLDAAEAGLARSLMERAAALPALAGHVHPLRVQYRMHRLISAWSSGLMYGGRVVAADHVASRTLDGLEAVRGAGAAGSDPALAAPLMMLDTRQRTGALLPDCDEQVDNAGGGAARSLFNAGECDIVASHVARLVGAGVPAEGIAVISPYSAQVEALRQTLACHPGAEAVEVATVDSFQGREAEAVIISMVRSNPAGSIGFLSDARRMNVAVTRARRHVAVVADSSTVSRSPMVAGLLRHIREHGAWEHAGEGGAGSSPAGAERPAEVVDRQA